MSGKEQLELFSPGAKRCSVPDGFRPLAPKGFSVERIVLCSGSLATPEREDFVRRVCGAYPDVPVEERLDTPHNRIELGATDPVERHGRGKRTLVFGELGDAVRFSEEEGNTCPNYWHFSVYGFCPYGCTYCYLAGTQGVWFSPTVKVYVNLPETLARIDRIANHLGRVTAFYHGKLQDGLALDPLTAYSTALVPFFARHRFARHVLLTKSTAVDRLLKLEHNGHTTLSWSLNPPDIARRFESNVPDVEARIEAMQQCAEAGYPVRAVIMPLIPMAGWEDAYTGFVRDLLTRVPLARLTLGGVCSYTQALRLMEHRLGKGNAISAHLQGKTCEGDGRARFAREFRVRMYDCLIDTARQGRPDLPVALCLEEREVWRRIHARWGLGACNCVL